MEIFIALYLVGCLISSGISIALEKEASDEGWKVVGLTLMSWLAIGVAIGVYIKCQEEWHSKDNQ
jgi:hypothetical protein